MNCPYCMYFCVSSITEDSPTLNNYHSNFIDEIGGFRLPERLFEKYFAVTLGTFRSPLTPLKRNRNQSPPIYRGI